MRKSDQTRCDNLTLHRRHLKIEMPSAESQVEGRREAILEALRLALLLFLGASNDEQPAESGRRNCEGMVRECSNGRTSEEYYRSQVKKY